MLESGSGSNLEFCSQITSHEQLRELMGEPVSPIVVAKTISRLDTHCLAFIARAPFMLMASSDKMGRMDISPRGDPGGFVKVLDDHTLAIPDRPGNQRFDTLSNLLDISRIALIFLIPGKRETLRVSGSARIVADPDLCAKLVEAGKTPKIAIVVDVEEAFFHCSKCMIRSKLWQPEAWPSLEGLPTLAQTMIDATQVDVPVAYVEGRVSQDEEHRLY